MHPGQLRIDADMVARLVAEQFPRWAALRVVAVREGGTVNAVFRVGSQLVARFPLVGQDAADAERVLREEADRAQVLAERTRFPTPTPVTFGRPGPGYPLPWAVYTWVPGDPAWSAGHREPVRSAGPATSVAPAGSAEQSGPGRIDPAANVAFAEDLAEFIGDVRAIDTGGRRHDGRGRGGADLRAHDAWMSECFERSVGLLDVAPLRTLWSTLRLLPRGDAPDVMSHGDLIGGNVLVRHGRLAGVIDVGGLGPADPGLDLVCAWHLLDAEAREVLRVKLGVDDLTWERGRAWAFEQALGAAWYYVTSHPTMSQACLLTLRRIVAA